MVLPPSPIALHSESTIGPGLGSEYLGFLHGSILHERDESLIFRGEGPSSVEQEVESSNCGQHCLLFLDFYVARHRRKTVSTAG